MRMVGLAWLAALGLAACGGTNGGDDDDGGNPDGGNCDATGVCDLACGVVYRDGCEPVVCGLCRYDGDVIDPEGESASMIIDHETLVAFVAASEVRLAALEGISWTMQTVSAIDVASGGGTSTAVWRKDSGETWVAWNDSASMIFTAHRGVSSGWTVDPSLGRGVRPHFAQLDDGTVVLAYAGVQPSGIQVHRRTLGAGAWGPATTISDDAYAMAMAADGADVHIAWRNGSQDVRYARSAGGGAFAVEDVRTGVGGIAIAATIGLDLDGGGAPHLAFSVGELITVHAERSGSAWTSTELGQGFGQDGGATLAIGERVRIAYFNAFSLRLAERAGAGFADQVVANRCDTGQVALADDDDGALQVVYSCESDQGVYWLRRRDDRFPDGWSGRCDAVAERLFTTACSCAADPQRPECCIQVDTDDGIRRSCSSGQTPRAIAEAVVCGDPTVDPANLDACAPAADAATCVAEDGEGTVVVPAACLP